jgi:hypothetical protein
MRLLSTHILLQVRRRLVKVHWVHRPAFLYALSPPNLKPEKSYRGDTSQHSGAARNYTLRGRCLKTTVVWLHSDTYPGESPGRREALSPVVSTATLFGLVLSADDSSYG